LRTEVSLDCVGELDIVAANRKADRPQVVHSTTEQAPLVKFAGRPNSCCQSVVSTTLAR
jgi:hypothetical protein